MRRWADLRSRALLLTASGALTPPPVTSATGRPLPIGVDVQQDAAAVQAEVHAVFEPADGVAAPEGPEGVVVGVGEVVFRDGGLAVPVGESPFR